MNRPARTDRPRRAHAGHPTADPPTAQNSLALSMPGTPPTNPTDWVTYVYTLQGDDIVLHLDGLAGPVLWRGRDVDTEDHNNAVRTAALERLLPPDAHIADPPSG